MHDEKQKQTAGARRRLGWSLIALVGVLVSVAAACSWRLHTRAPAKDAAAVAPDFALPDYRGGTVTLDVLVANGPAVVIFYRGYWWPFCRKQLGKLNAIQNEYKKQGVGLALISADTTEDSANYAAEAKIDLPLLADPGLQVISAYGVAMEGKDIAVPSTFIIGQDKKIRWKYVGENMADRPDERTVLDLANKAR